MTNVDLGGNRVVCLQQRLRRDEFNVAVLETYDNGFAFFGIYDATRAATTLVCSRFCRCAIAFLLDGVRALPRSVGNEEALEVYPRVENRTSVISHSHRERSSYLAAQCKDRDDYTCQVCGLSFEETYGKLGRGFAEAHHLTPLSQLDGEVKTRLEDLTTVCANCHRMLHRMSGKRGDVAKLKRLVAREK